MRIASVQSFFKLALIVLLTLSQAAYAVMIEAQPTQDPATVAAQVDPVAAERAKVREFFERANVKERLTALGVSGLNAQQRVDALTPAEVHAMAQRIEGMPAGGALSHYDWILILLVAILLIVAL